MTSSVEINSQLASLFFDINEVGRKKKIDMKKQLVEFVY